VAQLRAVTARALELDPELGEAHAALGILKLFFEWDWDGAGQALRKAIALNPNDAHAYHHLANYLNVLGRQEEAVAARERSLELDPLNARTRYVMGGDYLNAGQPERALEALRGAVQLDPVHPLGLGLGPGLPSSAARVYLAQGRTDEAVEDLLRVALLRNASAREHESMRRAHREGGMPGFWRAWREMDSRTALGVTNTLRSAAIWGMIGDTARALDELERAHLERNPGLIYLRTEPAFAGLRSHSRFQSIVRRMNLQPQ
jgi:tetratricopeptide (TPR) repeat protein